MGLPVPSTKETWLHYSDTPDQIVMFDVEQTSFQKNSIFSKPKGLWITPEHAKDNWFDWCMGEDFRTGQLNFAHEVTLKPTAKLLRLNGADDIDQFTKQYAFSGIGSLLRKVASYKEEPLSVFAETARDAVHWDKVGKEYQGILIPKYISSRRLDHNAGWYYSWDCASGCIWSADAIESIVCRSNVSAGYVSRVIDREGLFAHLKKQRTGAKSNVG